MHHWSDNLFFGRTTEGDVRVVKFTSPPKTWPRAEDPAFATALFDLRIPAAQWCSIVAFVSRRGETTDAYMDATTVHHAAPRIHHQVSLNDATDPVKDRMRS